MVPVLVGPQYIETYMAYLHAHQAYIDNIYYLFLAFCVGVSLSFYFFQLISAYMDEI